MADGWLVALLLTIALAGPVLVLWWERRRGQRRQIAAALRGWRYEPGRWWRRRAPRTGYVLAGRTPSGTVWELVQDAGARRFIWRAPGLRAPYGALVLGPQAGETVQALFREQGLRAEPQIELPAPFELWTTHRHLRERLLDTEAVDRLSGWPPRPLPGALYHVVWRADGLAIHGRYHDSWPTIERIVDLGLVLAERATWSRTPRA